MSCNEKIKSKTNKKTIKHIGNKRGDIHEHTQNKKKIESYSNCYRLHTMKVLRWRLRWHTGN